MAVETETATIITCDNPACPNRDNPPRDLRFDDLTGWLVVNVEEYGVRTLSGVFCTFRCAGALAQVQTEGP